MNDRQGLRTLPQLPSPAGTTLVTVTRTLEPGMLQGHMIPDPAPVHSAYPWLLAASTLLAGVFCALYLTKPVIVTQPPAVIVQEPAPASPLLEISGVVPAPVPVPGELPDLTALPGEGKTARPEPADPRGLGAGSGSPYEETNLRIQHVMAAQGPDGEDLGKIELKVPVLYQSRMLRWTPVEIARARQLMAGLSDHQQRSRALREEGSLLLAEWNSLVGASIPGDVLRADSPSLPASQEHRAGQPGQETIRSVEIGK